MSFFFYLGREPWLNEGTSSKHSCGEKIVIVFHSFQYFIFIVCVGEDVAITNEWYLLEFRRLTASNLCYVIPIRQSGVPLQTASTMNLRKRSHGNMLVAEEITSMAPIDLEAW